MHQNDIDGKTVEPRRKCRVAAKCGDLSVKLKEGFLSQVLGFGRITHHAQAQGVNPPLVDGIEVGECLMIACLSA